MTPQRASPGLQTGEFAWTQADFVRIQALIYQHAGINLHDGKHAMVYSRLSRRLRETGHASFGGYLGWLQNQEGAEWQEFVNALTTNLTSFFRERHHFEIFSNYLATRSESGVCRVWCSAASTGEEPYSIAMTLLESLEARSSFELAASDIDSKVLAVAEKGIYQLEALKDIGDERLQRFFMRGTGANAGVAKVKPELRQSVRFLNVNLIRDGWPFQEPFDIVFCRNVMIYFDEETQRRVLQRLHRIMKPGALLFAGHSENFSDSRDLFVLRGKTVYQRV